MSSAKRHSTPQPRPWPILGDAMEPTFRPGDYLIVEPADFFTRDGIYVVGVTHPNVYRCSMAADGMVLMSRDNPKCGSQLVSREWFNDNCLGIATSGINIWANHAMFHEALGRVA